jgi:hypothetical protein
MRRASSVRAKQLAKLAVLDFEYIYSRMTAEERIALKAWIENVAPLARISRSKLVGKLTIDIRYQVGEATIQVVALPATIKNAIEHCDRGVSYTPTSVDELD